MKPKKFIFRFIAIALLGLSFLYILDIQKNIIDGYGLLLLIIICIYYISKISNTLFDFDWREETPRNIDESIDMIWKQNIFSKGFWTTIYNIIRHYNKKYLFVMISVIFFLSILEYFLYSKTNLNLTTSSTFFVILLILALPDIKSKEIYFGKYKITNRIAVTIGIYAVLFFLLIAHN